MRNPIDVVYCALRGHTLHQETIQDEVWFELQNVTGEVHMLHCAVCGKWFD